MILKIARTVGIAIIVCTAFAIWMIVTWAVVAEPDIEPPPPVEPVHTIKESIVDCDVIYDIPAFFLALCIKPQIIESGTEPWTNSDTPQRQ